MLTRLASLFVACLVHAALLFATPQWSWFSPVDDNKSERNLHIAMVSTKPQADAQVASPPPTPPPVESAPTPRETPKSPAPERSLQQSPAPKAVVKKSLRREPQAQPKKIAKPQPAPPADRNVPARQEITPDLPPPAPPSIDVAVATTPESEIQVAMATAAETASAGLDKLEERYKLALLQAIDRHKRYPKSARRRGREGQAVIDFVVLADGQITGITLSEQSAWRSLDRAAVQTIEKLAKFEPIPEQLHRRQWAFSVPIRFTLD